MLSLQAFIVITVISNDKVIQRCRTGITPRGHAGLIKFPIKQKTREMMVNNTKAEDRSSAVEHSNGHPGNV